VALLWRGSSSSQKKKREEKNLGLKFVIHVPDIPSKTGAGVILCIEKALAHSGVSKEDVNYINAHATSTPAGDMKEYQALIHCFGQNPEVTWMHNVCPLCHQVLILSYCK
jgi:hypothetical protein